jgi:hypothetical protein
MRSSRFLGPVVATFLVAAAGLLAIPVAPATADPMTSCAGTAGVIVVVDFNELGGGLTRGCDGTSGQTAAADFAAAGYSLTYSHAPGLQGFVCTVQGKPSNGDCTGTDAYWSLWWSDGKSNTWTYASLGADSLTVPSGGYVAFAWHQGSDKATGPDVQPTPRKAGTPIPTPPQTTIDDSGMAPPAHHHTASASATATPSASASASVSPSATPKPRFTPRSSPTPTPTPTPSATSTVPTINQVSAGPPPDTSDHSGASTGSWIAIGLGVLVIGGAAAVPLLRRRRG